MNSKIKQRVFIVGCPRSGTTFLQTLLSQHPEVISFPESHFFTNSFLYPRRYKRLISIHNSLNNWNDVLQSKGYKYFPVKLSVSITNYVGQFIETLDQNALLQGRTIWIEKTPSHLYTIRMIQKYIPNAKFIHIVRNGEDVVASLYEVTNRFPEIWGKKYTIQEAVDRYNKDVSISMNYEHKPNHLIVKYETLLDSLDNIKKVYAFLDLVPPEEIKLISDMNIILKEEKWKANNYKSKIIDTRGKKFRKFFTLSEQKYIQNSLYKVHLF